MKFVCHLMSDAIGHFTLVVQKSVGDLRIYVFFRLGVIFWKYDFILMQNIEFLNILNPNDTIFWQVWGIEMREEKLISLFLALGNTSHFLFSNWPLCNYEQIPGCEDSYQETKMQIFWQVKGSYFSGWV